MAVFEIEAHGKTYEVEAPDQATALKALQQMGPAAPAPAPPRPKKSDWESLGRGALEGLSFGFDDEIGAGISALMGGDFGQTLAESRRLKSEAREDNPWAYGIGTIGGALPTAVIPGGAIARGVQGGGRVLQAMKAGAGAGAAYGGLAGAGYADGGLADRGVGAAAGAGLGAALGGAFPLLGAGFGAAAKPVRDAVAARVNPRGYAARKVVERMSIPTEQAARRLERSPGMALMDVGGEGARNLARTVANTPGRGAQRLTTSGNLRAMAQGDRIKTQVGRVFADPDGYQAVKEGIIRARRHRAAPAYDAAYRTPVPFTRELEALLNTPAGMRAMAAAKANSLNSRQPWAQWFLNVSDDGRILDARRVPDMPALDQIKRVLDDMVEGAMRQPDGSPFARAMQTPESRAIKSVRDDLLDILDSAVPAYREARRIAGETIKWDEALEFGRKALNMDSRVLRSKLATMTNDELEMARVGIAEAIRKRVDDAGFTHNALLKIFSSREQIRRLKPFFRRAEDWTAFRKAMFEEAKKRRSYDVLRGNSTTARQLADMAEAGTLSGHVQAGAAAANRGLTAGVLNAVAQGIRRLGGTTPETADQMATLLATRDPAKVREIAQMLSRLESRQGSAQEARSAIRQALTRLLATQEGRAAGSLLTNTP